jgi:hypothetical protein
VPPTLKRVFYKPLHGPKGPFFHHFFALKREEHRGLIALVNRLHGALEEFHQALKQAIDLFIGHCAFGERLGKKSKHSRGRLCYTSVVTLKTTH